MDEIATPLARSLEGTHQAEVADGIAMEDFFKDPQNGGFQISPNGEYFLFWGQHLGRMNVHVQKIGDPRTITVITRETERNIPIAFWKDDQTIIYAKDVGGDENFHIMCVDRDGRNAIDLTPWPNVKANVLDILADRPGELLIETNRRNAQVFDVYLVNTNTGETKLVGLNPGNITRWITDHDGKIRAAVATDGATTSLLFRQSEMNDFENVITTSFRDVLYPCLFTFDNNNLYCVSNLGRDKKALVEFDPRNGKETNVIYERPDVDIDGAGHSKKRRLLTVVYLESERPQKHFLDSTTAALHEIITTQMPNYIAQIVCSNREENKFVVFCWSDRYPGGEYFFDATTLKLEKLVDSRPWLKEENMSEMKPIQYKSRDGLTIHGYLTIPKSREAANLPIIVNPHGGPWVRDCWGFNPEIQFLANRGYGVLQMNFRGSKGYGRKFWEASFKQWGGAMLDDVTDGVKWLIKNGIADPTRIGIYGGSYGGYTALAAITFTPELYACAVDYVGIANMFTFLATIPPYWEPYRDMVYEIIGDPKKDARLLEQISPVFHADKIRCPLLVAQGVNDVRVKKAESDQMVDALRKRGLSVEYIVKENEGHGFSNQENKFEFYGAMEIFFEKHLKNLNKEEQHIEDPKVNVR